MNGDFFLHAKTVYIHEEGDKQVVMHSLDSQKLSSLDLSQKFESVQAYNLLGDDTVISCAEDMKMAPEKIVFVHYEGFLRETTANPKPFESSRKKNLGPFFFKLTPDWNAVPGIVEGILGACPGEMRRITVPASEAYGDNGTEDDVVPPNADVYFDVEIIQAKTFEEHEREYNVYTALNARDFDEIAFLEILEENVRNGLDINCIDQDGKTMLHYAANKNMTLLAQRLLNNKEAINTEIAFATGITPVFYAAGEGNIHILNLLIQAGANINRALINGPVEGFTPLHFACLKGQVDAVKILINSGASATVRATNGLTPLGVLESFLKKKTHMDQQYENDSKMYKSARNKFLEIKTLLDASKKTDGQDEL